MSYWHLTNHICFLLPTNVPQNLPNISNKKHRPSKIEPISCSATIIMLLVSGMPLTCGIIKFDSLVLLLMRQFILQRTGATCLSLRQQPESKQPGVNRTATNSFLQRRHRDTQKEKNAAHMCSQQLHPPEHKHNETTTHSITQNLGKVKESDGEGLSSLWRLEAFWIQGCYQSIYSDSKEKPQHHDKRWHTVLLI